MVLLHGHLLIEILEAEKVGSAFYRCGLSGRACEQLRWGEVRPDGGVPAARETWSRRARLQLPAQLARHLADVRHCCQSFFKLATQSFRNVASKKVHRDRDPYCVVYAGAWYRNRCTGLALGGAGLICLPLGRPCQARRDQGHRAHGRSGVE